MCQLSIENIRTSIRPINQEDCMNVLEIRNMPHVRSAMLSDKIINQDEHFSWFEKMLRDGTKDFYVFEINEEIKGVVGFFDITDHEANWTFYLKEEKPVKGSGTKMCKSALEAFFKKYGFRSINTKIKLANIASIKLHEKLGFEKNKTEVRLQSNLAYYQLSKEGWIAFNQDID